MWNPKNYRMGFDPWGLGLFLLIMLPNFVWFIFPAPNDILRTESITPLIDTIAQVFQIIMVASLCGMVNTARNESIMTEVRGIPVLFFGFLFHYYVSWKAYYQGPLNAGVILKLCLEPCGIFLLLALVRKNALALLAAVGFTICHLISTVINFIL